MNLKKILRSHNFPNYETFTNIDEAFHLKLMESIAEVALFKVARVKNKTPESFNIEVYDKIKSRVKRFKKFKKSKLHRDSVLYIEARNDVNRTI